uniref:SelT-like protein n=1 Tax=Schistocephalus solidus TaxID=70667 RepID=A0A0X3NVQ6_SCHSO
MARIVHQHYPSINIEGSTYPPPRWRSIVASIVQICKFLLLALTITGVNPFPSLGLETPGFFTYATENKVSFCLMTFFIGGMIESQLLSTGAFEISFNGIPVWSKLQSSRIPRPEELLQIIGSQVQFEARAPGTSFTQSSSLPPNL